MGHHHGHWGHGWRHRHHRFGGGGIYIGGSCWRTVWTDVGPTRVYVCDRYL
jgi:hypothetical protein